MTISLKRHLPSKPKKGEKISPYTLAFVRGRNKNKAHSLVLKLFQESGLTKKELAEILGKKPEQITRWLAGPGNMNLDTLSDLVFAAGNGQFLDFQCSNELDKGKSNHQPPSWILVKTNRSNITEFTSAEHKEIELSSKGKNWKEEVQYEIRSVKRNQPEEYSV